MEKFISTFLIFTLALLSSQLVAQITISGTGSNYSNGGLDGSTFISGCFITGISNCTGVPGSTRTICPNTPDASTNYYNGYSPIFIYRKNNFWLIESVATNGSPCYSPGARTTLFHTKYSISTTNPPCSAVWIRDADGLEMALSIAGTTCTMPCTASAAPTITVGGTTCSPTLTASACPSGGTIRWNTGSTATTITPLTNDKYVVLCDYGNNCPSLTATTTVTGLVESPTAGNQNQVYSCTYFSGMSLYGSCSTGTISRWSDGVTTYANGYMGIPKIGIYTATCSNGTCTSGTSSIAVTVLDNLLLPMSNGNKTICSGDPLPALSASFPPPSYSYYAPYYAIDWYANATGGTVLLQNSTSYTPSSAGTYYATMREVSKGCFSSSRVAVAVSVSSMPVTLSLVSPANDYSATPAPPTKSAVTIVASNTISSNATTVNYLGGKSVTLNAGFKANNGTVFKAEVGGCQ